jgi:glutamyl-tRNA reductase
MKIQPNESIESWAERVAVFEKDRALKHIVKGIDIDIVLAEMSRRIMDKLLYPILHAIRQTHEGVDMEKFEKDKQAYYELMKIKGKAADHVDTNS